MAKKNHVPDFKKLAESLKHKAARIAGSESVKFFKESFVKQGFTDTSFEAWLKTQNPLAGKRTMYKSGKLMQSIRKTEETTKRVTVIADSDYAEIQNSGGYIVVTLKMKNFFWAKHIEFKDKNKKKAEFCKAMALKKEGDKIKIPPNKFIGNSQTLLNILKEQFEVELHTAFKQRLNA